MVGETQIKNALWLALLLPLVVVAEGLETAVVGYQEVAREQLVDGVIEAVNRSTVSAQISGQIEAIYFDVDDYVEKDEVIMRFRDTEPRTAVDVAKAHHAQAQSDFKRISGLVTKGVVSQAQYDKAEAIVKASAAELEQRQEQLQHTVIKAPYSGIVVKRHVEVGELAKPGQALVTGLSLERLRATTSISQRHIVALREYTRARIIPSDDQALSIVASRLTISPYSDPVTRTFFVRADLAPGEYQLYPGMFVKVAFTIGKSRLLLAPAAALARRGEVTAVYVVGEQGRIRFRRVRVGRSEANGLVEILSGLEGGERVALDPIQAVAHLKGFLKAHADE